MNDLLDILRDIRVEYLKEDNLEFAETIGETIEKMEEKTTKKHDGGTKEMSKWNYKTFNFRRVQFGVLLLDIIIEDDENNTITSYVIVEDGKVKVEYSLLNNDNHIFINREQRRIITENALEVAKKYL